MSKRKSVVIAIVGTVLVFLGILITVVSTIQEQKNNEQERETQIIENYKQFKQYTDQFAGVRKEYYKQVVENLYYESVADEYHYWIQQLTTYQQLVTNIMIAGVPLETLCVGQIYNSEVVNNSCDAYVINYETAVNYFVKDVEEFNVFINNYIQEYGVENNKIQPFTINARQYYYVDINDDGKYIGKN